MSQNFDTGYIDLVNRFKALGPYDFDFELYDSEKEGNSKDNVTSGRYSLHRKGNTKFFEQALLITDYSNSLSKIARYTVTMKVKLGKHLHTDGAIKIVSNKSSTYAWSAQGDYYPIVAIKDLKEGEWVEVSYTFNSIEAFASIQTPGYVELFIDDVEFNLVTDENTLVSTPVSYTEYVVAERDSEGNIIELDASAIDIDSIIDGSLKRATKLNVVTIVIICAAAVVVAGAVVLILFLAKRKKAKTKI